MSKFRTTFDAHPECNELYVVNGMAFINKEDAQNFARGNNNGEVKFETVKRLVKKKPAPKKPAPKKPDN